MGSTGQPITGLGATQCYPKLLTDCHMPTLQLMQAAVEKLRPPATGRVEYWDSQLPEFWTRHSARRLGSKDSRKIWQAYHRVHRRRFARSCGTFEQIPSVADARDLARKSMTKARAGRHPVEERRVKEEEERHQAEAEAARKRNTVGAVIDRDSAEGPIDKSRKPMRAEYLAETARTLIQRRKTIRVGRAAAREHYQRGCQSGWCGISPRPLRRRLITPWPI